MWRISLAFKYLFPRKISFFTAISILGISIGVMVLIVVNGIMSGFGKEIQTKLMQINGSVKILSKDGIINDFCQLENELQQLNNVTAITKFANGVVFVQHEKYVWFPKILGVDINTISNVIPIKSFIKLGNLNALDNNSVILSSSLANTLGAKIGSKIDVYSPLMMEALTNEELLLPQELNVIAIFETGWAEVDKDTIICSLQSMQQLYGLNKGIHGFMLNVSGSNNQLANFCQNLNNKLPKNLKAYSWMDINEDFLYVLKLEKTMSLFVVIFVVVIAAFSISSGLMTSVVRKSREIALLQILGASKSDIIIIFLTKALILSTIGSLIGSTAGITLLATRNQIMQILMNYVLPQDVLWKFYSFANLPAYYTSITIIVISITTVSITLLAAIIPALKATANNKNILRENFL